MKFIKKKIGFQYKNGHRIHMRKVAQHIIDSNRHKRLDISLQRQLYALKSDIDTHILSKKRNSLVLYFVLYFVCLFPFLSSSFLLSVVPCFFRDELFV